MHIILEASACLWRLVHHGRDHAYHIHAVLAPVIAVEFCLVEGEPPPHPAVVKIDCPWQGTDSLAPWIGELSATTNLNFYSELIAKQALSVKDFVLQPLKTLFSNTWGPFVELWDSATLFLWQLGYNGGISFVRHFGQHTLKLLIALWCNKTAVTNWSCGECGCCNQL